MSLRLTVHLQVQAGRSADFEAAAAAAIVRVRAEDKGCEAYGLYRSLDDDTQYVMVEAWASEEDLDSHGKSPAMAEMMKIAPFMAGPPVMHRYSD